MINTEYREEFRKSLPIYQHRSEIIQMIKENKFCIITGETGSGKTTQIPQYIIESLTQSDFDTSLPLSPPKVVITQPRRVATIQMAKRVAYEKDYALGKEVGYTIRFEDNSSDSTLIKYVTDGILVKECLYDKSLSKYQVIIIDEAHERSLYSDILFALAKQAVLSRNNSLKLIITSATLNIEQFKAYFNACPAIKVSGKLYPVDITYHPSRMEKRVESSVQLAIRIHLHEGPGHILSFLTGFEECEQACKMAYSKLDDLAKKGKQVNPMMIMPLYGAQNTEDQARIFEKVASNCRKLIYCTNIAETSLTVDGVGFVIDSGYIKQKTFNHKTSMDSLMIVPISKVQAIQRAGRAGRTGPGKCLRIYTDQFLKMQMPDAIIPEILRVNLSSTILSLKSMGIENVVDFDFLEQPDKDSIIEALKELYYLQAIDPSGHITKLGIEMVKFPLDCCYARALIASIFYGVNEEMKTLVSLISSESVWVNVNKYDEEKRMLFEKTKLTFIDRFSDHMTLLNVYKELEYNSFNEEWSHKHFIHLRALKQARNIKTQIGEYINKVNVSACEEYFNIKSISVLKRSVEEDKSLDDYEKVNVLLRMALSQGFFMNTTRKMANSKDGMSFIRIIDGCSVSLDHFSSIAIKEMKPELVMYTELGGTITKPMMKMGSIIEVKWIQDQLVLLKDVDVGKLKGDVKKEGGEGGNDNNSNNVGGNNKGEIDLYALLNKNRVSSGNAIGNNANEFEPKLIEDDEEALMKKSQEAKERYLHRKRNQSK